MHMASTVLRISPRVAMRADLCPLHVCTNVLNSRERFQIIDTWVSLDIQRCSELFKLSLQSVELVLSIHHFFERKLVCTITQIDVASLAKDEPILFAFSLTRYACERSVPKNQSSNAQRRSRHPFCEVLTTPG